MLSLLGLRKRLPVYLKDAGKIVDLSYYELNWNGTEYTQEELIKVLIEKVRDAKNDYHGDDKARKAMQDVLEIWKIICPAMWW